MPWRRLQRTREGCEAKLKAETVRVEQEMGVKREWNGFEENKKE